MAWQRLDKRRWKRCCEDDELIAYEAVVWSVALKQKVKVVYVKARERKGYEALVCTDVNMEGKKTLGYYRLRFQTQVFDPGRQDAYRAGPLSGKK